VNALTKSGDFTKKARQQYRREGKCPYCGGFNYGLDGKQIADGDVLSNRIQCSDCLNKWWDIYKLQNIEPTT
jgi:C4-type Zn-finger protein